ncbi:hypothetical protein HGRIS_001488 [Hohenbuehelia grisea]|uniref:Uncharacterized protein n=1 Tax=Hohenbuehelia grisea TaxID=104357 RepID=A0ABR3JPF9_9AGAR
MSETEREREKGWNASRRLSGGELANAGEGPGDVPVSVCTMLYAPRQLKTRGGWESIRLRAPSAPARRALQWRTVSATGHDQ